MTARRTARCSAPANSGEDLARSSDGIVADDPLDIELATEPSTTQVTDSLTGHLDDTGHDLVRGWAFDATRPGKPVTIEVAVEGVEPSFHTADAYRPDLKAAGVGSGRHGFAIRLSRKESDRAQRHGTSVTVSMVGARKAPLASFALSETIAITEDGAALLHTAATTAQASGLTDAQDDPRTGETPSVPGYRALFEAGGPSVPLTPSAARSAHRVSPYLHQVSERHGVHASMRSDDQDPDHLYRWYIDHLARAELPRRAPLGRDDIRFLNERVTVGGKRFALSRALFWYGLESGALGDPRLLDDEDAYRRLLYAWARRLAPNLGVEDCLVTRAQTDVLKDVPPEHRRAVAPLSAFAKEALADLPGSEALGSPLSSSGRLNLYFFLLLTALREPGILRFLPRAVIDRFLLADDPLLDAMLSALTDKTGSPYTIDGRRYRASLEAGGFDLHAMRFKSVTPRGHRIEAHALALPSGIPVEVQVIGPLSRVSGLGSAARASRSVLSQTEYTTNFFDFIEGNPQPGHRDDGASNPLRPSEINIIHVNPDLLPDAYAYLPDVFAGAYNIGFFFWELSEIAPCHTLALQLVDEIWVSSEYNRAIFSKVTDKPVINVGLRATPDREISRTDARRGVHASYNLPHETFVYYSSYDSFSYFERKNPLLLLRAFEQAFGGSPDVHLILKTHNATAVGDERRTAQWRALTRAVEDSANVSLINETLETDALRSLSAGADCFVSLHRSEGLGLGMLEAMGHGTPVVCTAYSGNLDFCTAQTAWLVACHEVSVRPGEYAYATGREVWAEPDLASAVDALRSVHRESALRDQRARNARALVTDRYGPAATTERYGQRLGEILRMRRAASAARAVVR